MLSGLYIKLIASAIVLAVIGGGYAYVRGLQTHNETLQHNITLLAKANEDLTEELKDQKRMNEIQEKVLQAGDIQRNENRKQRDSELKNIDDKVKTGKDRQVGPLLKEFFNHE